MLRASKRKSTSQYANIRQNQNSAPRASAAARKARPVVKRKSDTSEAPAAPPPKSTALEITPPTPPITSHDSPVAQLDPGFQATAPIAVDSMPTSGTSAEVQSGSGTDPCGTSSLAVWGKMIDGICFWITQQSQNQSAAQSLCNSHGGHLVMEITSFHIIHELYLLASAHNVHQEYKYVGYYVDPTTQEYNNFTTIVGDTQQYKPFTQNKTARKIGTSDYYCVSLLNELFFAERCTENLRAVCSNFVYVPVTSEPISTTREPFQTTTEPVQTTTEPAQTTTEPAQTTTIPFHSIIRTTTESIHTTEPTTVAHTDVTTSTIWQTTETTDKTTDMTTMSLTGRVTTTPGQEECDCFEFCKSPNYDSGAGTLLINDTEKLQERLKAIKDILTVEKTTLSSAVRKKTSAPDERTSSTNIGYFGIAIIVSAISIIVIFDIVKFFQIQFG